MYRIFPGAQVECCGRNSCFLDFMNVTVRVGTTVKLVLQLARVRRFLRCSLNLEQRLQIVG